MSPWCATLELGQVERGFLERWAAREAADVYVMTAEQVSENLHSLIVRCGRKDSTSGPEFYGEEALLPDLAKHLRGNGGR